MRKYEIMYVIRPNIEEDAKKALVERFADILTSNGAEIVESKDWGKRRLAYEQDADAFIAQYQTEQEALAAKIIKAGELLPMVKIADKLLNTVAKLAVELGVDGHRADITVIKTALTIAAFNARMEVEPEDVKQAAKLVLPHRMRRRPFEEGQLDWKKVESFLEAEA